VRRDITLGRVVSDALDSHDANHYHVASGNVVQFYAATTAAPASADIQPAVNDPRFDLDTRARYDEPFPLLSKVPIMWPKFGAFVFEGPLAIGDGVVLLAFDLDPSTWQASGKVSAAADTRRHAGAYWTAFPCNLTVPGRAKSGPAAASSLILGVDGGQAQIQIPSSGAAIQLGAAATDHVVLATPYAALLAALSTFAAGLTVSTLPAKAAALSAALAALPPAATTIVKAQ
jgi:hypothetical protein